jgi:6-phosphogluconolactonase
MMPQDSEIRVLADGGALAQAAADEFVRLAREALQRKGNFTVALSGGSTPKTLYSLLADRTQKSIGPEIPWTQIHLFFGDERHVPPDHTDSNYRMANEAMISKVPIPAANVHRIHTENEDAAAAAAEYDRTLVQIFNLSANGLPRFDLILLGMGPDGHTASLFPGTSGVQELSKRVIANWVPKFNSFRVTFTRPVLNNAAEVMLLISGVDKAPVLSEVLGSGDPDTYPVKYVQPRDGKLLWLLDKSAASRLDSSQATAS